MLFSSCAEGLVALAGDYSANVIVNDRVDVARLSGAHGVHVGQEDFPPAASGSQLGPDAIIGFSTHTVAQVEDGFAGTCDLHGRRAGVRDVNQGHGLQRRWPGSRPGRIAHGGPTPIVAIGGMTLGNARSAIDAGAVAVAVISDLLVGNPAARVKTFLRALE